MQKLSFFAIIIIVSFSVISYCQTPGILSSTIPYDSNVNMPGLQTGYESVNDIEIAFNNARRIEETQFCLPTNSISNLNLPSQAIWNNMNTDERFLFLANAERSARAGLNYCQGDGPASGLPFIGVESNIDNIAQTHAELLIATQSTSSLSQAANIDANPNIGGTGCDGFKFFRPNCCHTFVPYSVYRIYFTSNDTPANPSTITTEGLEARSVYFLVYGNGGVGNGRKMILMQDIESGGNSSNPCGFFDDYGNDGEEGFLGIGVAGGIPHPSFNRTHIDMVILSYFDPVPQSNGCNYNCTTCDACSTNVTQNSNPLASGNYQAANSITSSATIPGANIVKMQANGFVELSSSFEVKSGGTYSAVIDACYYTLN